MLTCHGRTDDPRGCERHRLPAGHSTATSRARRLASGSTVSATLEELETLAVEHYPWKQHTDDPDSYWVTVGQAAEILALSVQRVNQLLDEDRLPHVAHHSGVRLMRRAQLKTLANSRAARIQS